MVRAPGEHRFTVGRGIDLHAEMWSAAASTAEDGVGFVLVHGLASNAALWRGLAAQLCSLGHPVVALDQRGHGRSSKPDGPYDLPTFAADLAEVLDGLLFRRPVVVGQSFGGNVVLELAARRPDMLAGVVCVDGGWIELAERFPTWEACEAALAPPFLEGRRLEEIEDLLSEHHHDWPAPAITGFLAGFEVRDDATVAPWLSRPRHLQILHSLWEHRPSALYPSVRVPVLLVPAVNAGQPEGWDAAVHKAAALLPFARLIPMAGDHDLHAQHPEAMAALLHDWADGIPR